MISKNILLYLTALGFVNTNISALGLKISAGQNAKYSFNSGDVMKSIQKAEQVWKNISFANEIEWNFTDTVKTTLLDLTGEAIVQVTTSIETMKKIKCENSEQILSLLSDCKQRLNYLRSCII